MGLFDFGKKSEKVNVPTCACNAPAEDNVKGSGCCCAGIQNIKVLGAGCKSCHEMYENTKAAVSNAGINVEVEYITDMEKVMTYGIMSMPGLVINEKVVSMGKVLKVAELEKLFYDLLV